MSGGWDSSLEGGGEGLIRTAQDGILCFQEHPAGFLALTFEFLEVSPV